MTNIDIIRYLNDQAGHEEVAKIEAWIAESKENAITFHRWKSVWESAGAIAPPSAPDVDQAWNRVLPKLEKPPIPLYRRIRQIAAAVILLIGLSYFSWQYFFPSPTMMEVATLSGETKHLELPDGTKAWLNSDTEITYPASFAKDNRTISLSGEAYFEVVRMESAPFRIEGNSSTVQVLGTSFVVQTLPKGEQTKVVVKSGKVALFPQGQEIKNGLILKLGEQGTLNHQNGKLQKDSIQNNNYLAWQNKIVDFKNASITEVEETLEAVYKVSISIDNPALYNCILNGSYDNLPLEEILETFSFLFAAEVVKEGNDFRIIGGNGC